MNETPIQTEFQRCIDEVAQLATLYNHSGIAQRVSDLNQERQTDAYTILFLGEFNRGKSSLINSLLRTDILPMDVTPTTATINVIRFSENPEIRIQRHDGTSEIVPFTSNTLAAFTGDAKTDDISIIEIGMPNPLLRANTVIVDTPGVGDLNQQRIDITHNFVPQADAVVFVLSALTALNRSEVEFLQNAVLQNGINRILFVVNYMDSLNDTSPEELLSGVTNRIRTAIPNHSGTVYPVSARRALRGIRMGDSQTPNEMVALEKAIEALRETREIDKDSRLRFRLAKVTEAFVEELESSLAVIQATNEELASQMESLRQSLARREARRGLLRNWMNEREYEAKLMITKSCDVFELSLRTELLDLIAGYSGSDFEKFLALQVPKLVKVRLRDWAEVHGKPLSALLMRISNEIAASLSRTFNSTTAPIRRSADWSGITEISFSLPAIKVPNAMYRAGLIGGAAAGVVFLMGAPVVMPMIAMFGLPVLRDMLQEHNLASARPIACSHVHDAVNDVGERLRDSVMSSFAKELNAIGELSEKRLGQLLSDVHRGIEVERARRIEQHSRNSTNRDAISRSIIQLRNVCRQLTETGFSDNHLVLQPKISGE
jgi:GTPase SAR1 family protein